MAARSRYSGTNRFMPTGGSVERVSGIVVTLREGRNNGGRVLFVVQNSLQRHYR